MGLLGDGAGMAGLPGVAPGSLEAISDATMDASDAGVTRAKTNPSLGLRSIAASLVRCDETKIFSAPRATALRGGARRGWFYPLGFPLVLMAPSSVSSSEITPSCYPINLRMDQQR